MITPNRGTIAQEIVELKDERDLIIVQNANARELNRVLKNLTLPTNLGAEIVEVTIPAIVFTYRVSHNLKSVPIGRLILKQNTYEFTDGDYTDKYIEINNTSGAECKLTIAILKG